METLVRLGGTWSGTEGSWLRREALWTLTNVTTYNKPTAHARNPIDELCLMWALGVGDYDSQYWAGQSGLGFVRVLLSDRAGSSKFFATALLNEVDSRGLLRALNQYSVLNKLTIFHGVTMILADAEATQLLVNIPAGVFTNATLTLTLAADHSRLNFSSIIHHIGHLKKLVIRGIDLHEGVSEFASRIAFSETLSELTLASCQLDIHDVYSIAAAARCCASLHAIDLSGNPSIGNAGAACLAAAIAGKNGTPFTRVNLRACMIQNGGAYALASVMKTLLKSTGVPTLSIILTNNSISAACIRRITQEIGDKFLYSAVPVVKICMIGSGGIGTKSALTLVFLQNHFVTEYDPTIEDSYRKSYVLDGQPIIMDITDTAGQEEYSAMRDTYYPHHDVFCVGYSVTSRSSFEDVINFHTAILRVRAASDYPKVLLGGKCDLEAERVVSYDEGVALARQLNCTFLEVSAKTRVNVDTAFETAARAGLEDRRKGIVFDPVPFPMLTKLPIPSLTKMKATEIPVLPDITLCSTPTSPEEPPQNEDLIDWVNTQVP
ncbi:Ras protein Rap 1b [Pelomyxa schiedti]|nr:Ras protein Rap 1b [Pelomyxa schiedti]